MKNTSLPFIISFIPLTHLCRMDHLPIIWMSLLLIFGTPGVFLCSATSHLGLFCLSMSHKKDTRLIWVKSSTVVLSQSKVLLLTCVNEY